MPPIELTPLQRRIASALQINGRASWTRIAEVLASPERTVTRQGNDLLRSGRVTVAALGRPDHLVVLACESIPGGARLLDEALALRNDAIYIYQTTGEFNLIAELGYGENLNELLGLQVPAIPGLRRFFAFPVLKYFKTIRSWRNGALSEAEAHALLRHHNNARPHTLAPEPRGPNDAAIIEALTQNGRRSIESIARLLKMSETTVSRRIEWLRASGQLSIRTLVEPADLGFPVEAVLWVQAPSPHVEVIGQEIRLWPEVRHAAAIAGKYQLVVNVAARSHADLYQLLAHPVWAKYAAQAHADLIHRARKRGGRVLELA